MYVDRQKCVCSGDISSRLCFRSGVTFIELLLVIVIMMIIATASMPALTTLGRGTSLAGGVNSVTATLNLSRQWAISHRQRTGFYYVKLTEDSHNNYYGVHDWRRIDLTSSNQLPSGVVFDDLAEVPSTNYIWFRSDGSLESGAAPVQVHIADRNKEGYTKTLTVFGLTGRVKVED